MLCTCVQDGDFQQELTTLAQFFPAIPRAELLAVLEAFQVRVTQLVCWGNSVLPSPLL